MNNHFKISLIKSLIRIGGLIGLLWAVLYYNITLALIILGGAFLGAELLGIYEEIKDDRK